MLKYLFSSEAVFEGHPDKICDQVADRILDEALRQDSQARVACEVTANNNTLNIFGEITANANIDYDAIARDVIKEIGYTKSDLGFDYKTCKITCDIKKQSPDIALGVNSSLESKSQHSICNKLGAGDQGIMFGYASNETPEMMPLGFSLANKIAKAVSKARKNCIIPYLRPDGKCQVTVEYVNGVATRIHTIVVSAQHNPNVHHEQIERDIIDLVIRKVIPTDLLDENTIYIINPTGKFVLGGPACDSGLTGRKLICDTYGGYARHGGGAFSGKDATKVDRSAAYMARYISKNIVSSKLATKCEVQLGYAIGVSKPVSINIDTFRTETIPISEIENIIESEVDLSVDSIIRFLELTKPGFSTLSVYGHFGENAREKIWESDKLSKDILRKYSF